MCLAIPAKVLALDQMNAIVDMMGNRKVVNVSLVPEVKLEEFALIHAGYAIEVIDNESAKETEEILLKAADVYEKDE